MMRNMNLRTFLAPKTFRITVRGFSASADAANFLPRYSFPLEQETSCPINILCFLIASCVLTPSSIKVCRDRHTPASTSRREPIQGRCWSHRCAIRRRSHKQARCQAWAERGPNAIHQHCQALQSGDWSDASSRGAPIVRETLPGT